MPTFTPKCLILIVACSLACAIVAPAAPVAAQTQPAIVIQAPYQGDCSITLVLTPAGGGDVRIMIDSPNAPVAFKIAQVSPFVATLQDPLLAGSEVIVTVGTETERKRVADRPGDWPMPTACLVPKPDRNIADGRSTFEASGFFGRAFDNFAPSETLGYQKTVTGEITSRWTAGVEAQYRLIGGQESDRQLWLSTQTLHGVRTTDVDCTATPSVAVCDPKETLEKKFFAVLERASTMEAHVEARFEFLRLQATSDTPVKVYVTSRFGFLSLAGAPKVFSSDGYAGMGITAPKGSYRGSFAQVAWGRSRQFQSAPDANRLKIAGTLVYDLTPGLIGTAQNFFMKRVSATRFFVAIVVDRNPAGLAPDSVQSYVGLDFDLRRLVGAF